MDRYRRLWPRRLLRTHADRLTPRVLAAGAAVVLIVLASGGVLWLVERQRDAAVGSSARAARMLEAAGALEHTAYELMSDDRGPAGPAGPAGAPSARLRWPGAQALLAENLEQLRRLAGDDPIAAKRIGALPPIAGPGAPPSAPPDAGVLQRFRRALERFEQTEWSAETAQQHHAVAAGRILLLVGRAVTVVIVAAVAFLVVFLVRLLATPLRRVAEALRASERGRRRERDFAETVLRSMREGFMLTADGVIVEVNRAMLELTGFGREELLGAAAPFPFCAASPVSDAWPEPSPETDGEEFETVFTRKDGSALAVSVSVVAAAGEGERRFVHTVRDVSAQKRHEAELERLARQDPLTGLPNHRVFREQLENEIARARRQRTPLSLVVLDLDHFKQLNDSRGHPVGDRVLRAVGRRLASNVRTGETLARIGGEEFAWILPGVCATGAHAAAERARAAISETPFAGAGPVTVSAGVGELADGDGAGEDVYRKADQALYWAKEEGRNRTVTHAPEATSAAA